MVYANKDKSTEQVIRDFKHRAIFFPKGRIVPRWLMSPTKHHPKLGHYIQFGTDCWVLPQGSNGAVIAWDFGASAIHICIPKRKSAARVKIQGSPYGGVLHLIPNSNWNYQVWARSLFDAMQGPSALPSRDILRAIGGW